MASSVDIRPKQALGFFNRIRTQLLTVFLTIVGLIIVIGILSFNSQSKAQEAAEKLLGSDTEFIQAVLDVQGEVSELRRLEENFVITVRTADDLEAGIEKFVEPWFATVQDVRTKTGLLTGSDMMEMEEEDVGSMSDVRIDELESAFSGIVEAQSRRMNLRDSINRVFRVDIWLNADGMDDIRNDVLALSVFEQQFILTSDASFITAYREKVEEMQPALETAPLSDRNLQSLRDRAQTTLVALDAIADAERELNQRREVFAVLLNNIDDSLQRSIDQTLTEQAAAQDELSLLNQNTILGIIAILALAAVIAVFYMLTAGRKTVDQVKNLESTIQTIRGGNYRARARVLSSDETGYVAEEMNRVLDATFALIQSRDEQDAVQDAIFQFMEDVGKVAEGDLTARARGTHALTNDIALSFNETVMNLRDIIEQIQTTTSQVSAATGQIRDTAQSLSSGSESQADYIVDTSAAVDEMAISIQHVSENSQISTDVSAQARANAQAGTNAVAKTIDGMELIQAQVSLASSQVARLGDSSKDISQSIALINDIADRTSVLALNATIRALAAGDAGRGFTVVAREIESLAAQAAQAAQRVSELSAQMQTDATKTIGAMGETQSRVQTSLGVAAHAATRLQDIERVTERLSDVIREISHAAQQQARSSETVARSMSEISDVTQQTASGTHETMTSIDNLARLADELYESVRLFKLDNDAQPAGAVAAD